MTTDALLSVKEAAAYLTVSRWTVQREEKAGRLAHVRVRGGKRYRRSELDRYLKERERRRAA